MIPEFSFVNFRFVVGIAMLAAFVDTNDIFAQESLPQVANSTKKIRVRPDPLAAKAGTAVNWSVDFQAAAALSQQSGKPIFWYVPTIHGSFMDRKPEIDRYLMAGFFSNPAAIKILNDNFVPVKAVPSRQQQEQFELTAYKFIEPGFLILTDAQTAALKIDRITTLHTGWFLHQLAKFLNPESDQTPVVDPLATVPTETIELPPTWPVNPDPITVDNLVRLTWFKGMQEFRAGNQDSAQRIWRTLAKSAPDHPLTWKAAAEAQGIGPFVRGFEVYVQLPPACLEAGVRSSGSAAPAGTWSSAQLWERGVDFLLSMQNEQGGYVDSDYDFGGTDSLPNVHVAVTSLVGMALLESKTKLPPSRAASIELAIDKCRDYVTNEKNINRNDRDEILWAEAYRLRFLCGLKELNREADVDQDIQAATVALENIQSKRGNWYHEYENPFVTATALCALYHARQAGAQVDETKIDRGLSALAADRFANGAFPYSSNRRRSSSAAGESIPAAAGRMPVCELALLYWGKSDQQRLQAAVRNSLEFHKHLDVALKYDNHTSTFAYGGFFFWYDMRSRTEAMAAIADAELRRELMSKQQAIVMSLPEIDGCFVDSHELGRCYGTAMALLCLAETEKGSDN